MESSITNNQALLNELGMTAHIPRKISTVYSRKNHYPTIRNSLDSSRPKNQFLGQRRVLTNPSTALQDSLSTAFMPNDVSTSDPPLAPERPNCHNLDEFIAERKRKTVSLFHEIYQKEELRVAEVRNSNDSVATTPSSLFTQPPTQPVDQQNAVKNTEQLEEQESSSTTAVTLDQDSAFLFEPLKLGPRTSNLYRRGSLLPVRQISSASERSTASAASTCIELDGTPISDVMELSGGEVPSSCRPSYEYGDARFNTLPGESYPLTEYKMMTELPNVPTVTDHFLEIEIEQALKDLIRPDADPRTGLPFRTNDP